MGEIRAELPSPENEPIRSLENITVGLGGEWQPNACAARHRVVIIVPFRDRESHLQALLYSLHPVLQRQQLAYRSDKRTHTTMCSSFIYR